MGTNAIGCTEWERDFDPKTEQPHEVKTMLTAKFERQRFGAMVATIVETAHVTLEVLARNDGRFVLTVHNRTGETDRWEDLSVTLEPRHFEMLGSIARQQPLSEKRDDISDSPLPTYRCQECGGDTYDMDVGPPTDKPVKGIDVDEGGF